MTANGILLPPFFWQKFPLGRGCVIFKLKKVENKKRISDNPFKGNTPAGIIRSSRGNSPILQPANHSHDRTFPTLCHRKRKREY
jgi:hypothetical protein